MHGTSDRVSRRLPVEPGTISSGLVPLESETKHYAFQVLRLALGTEIEVFDGEGTTGRGLLAADGVDVTSITLHPPSTPHITLYQAIPKGDRWDAVLEKATELGVDTIVPLLTQWSVVQVPSAKAAPKVERWQKIVRSAARQSERVYTPVVRAQTPLADAIRDASEDSHWLADAGGKVVSVPSGESVGIWIGPEAGFSPREIAMLAHTTRISLGPNILRSETAGIFAVGLARLLSGS
jgi:16S rRNA (uracil1498-N3)-methyltransferase